MRKGDFEFEFDWCQNEREDRRSLKVEGSLATAGLHLSVASVW